MEGCSVDPLRLVWSREDPDDEAPGIKEIAEEAHTAGLRKSRDRKSTILSVLIEFVIFLSDDIDWHVINTGDLYVQHEVMI